MLMAFGDVKYRCLQMLDGFVSTHPKFATLFMIDEKKFHKIGKQAEIMGQTVTWVVPHSFAYDKPESVDLKLMSIFVEFYTTMLGFVNFRLFHNLNLHYPPSLVPML